MKTNKHKTLLLAKNQRALDSHDLVRKFDYSPGTARSYLSRLGRQGLLKREYRNYVLTEKGRNRIRYFAIFGCRRPGCPHCLGKLGHLTCPNCEHRIAIQQAKILKRRDYLLVVREAGVYCDQCSTMILDESQAMHHGIHAEK
jgi:predicted methyltransferase